jgi:hypothetical protein
MRSALPNASADQIDQALKATGIQVTETGAGFSLPKIQVMHAINYVTGHNEPIVNQISSSNAATLGVPYLRVFNNSSAPGTATFTFLDATSGTVLGTWTTPAIPAQASPQFSIQTLEQSAVPAQGQTVAASGRSFYNVQIASNFSGYIQYVTWAPTAGLIENLTSCATGPSLDGSTVMNVDSSNIPQYVSHLRMTNTGAVAAQATLTFLNAASGQQVGQWTSASIPAGASVDVTEPQIESAVSSLASASAAGASQYNVSMSVLSGYLEHVVENRLLPALTDMSTKCQLSP